MKTGFCLPLATFALFALCAQAGVFFPLSSTNAIVLNFASEIPEVLELTIREDFQRCLAPSAAKIRLYHYDRDPTNRMSLAGFWQPYSGFAATSPLGPDLPGDGILSNGIFTIDVAYSFATNFQHQIDSTAAYSNEIAAAYTFIDSLTTDNLQNMSTNQLLSMDLWKKVEPGLCPITGNDLNNAIAYCRNRRVFAPPLVAFHVWDCGPTNNPPYLWCTVPAIDNHGHAFANMMIYFQNQWWFSSWPFQNGEQQW